MQIAPALAAAAVITIATWTRATPAHAGETVLQSRPGERAASLLELYTSEGCSSCPPAEAWLSRLKAHPRLWREFVPVAFHVDYWDNLGWRDRFSSGAFTSRQRDYGARWGGETIYTPEFVLDGREWQSWRANPGAAPAAQPGGRAGTDPGALAVTVKDDGRTVAVSFTPATRPGAAREAFVTLLGFDLSSAVRSGENRGRNLSHDFVALGWERKTLAATAGGVPGRQGAVFHLPAPPGDTGRLAVAAWVAEPGNPGAEQVIGGWLAPAPALGLVRSTRDDVARDLPDGHGKTEPLDALERVAQGR